MAEILLSLTIIGVVAAITLPSLTGNINERTWNTQRKALYARFSQAIALMPALNGYGILTEDADGNVTEDTAAETFVTNGLSKVLKINNVCDSEHLNDCGLPNKIIAINGSEAFSEFPKTLVGLNEMFSGSVSLETTWSYHQTDTKAAAFETANGESVAVYYSPTCKHQMAETQRAANGTPWYNTQTKICANFIYDLNGQKGPNTVGKDIGFITALYPVDSVVVAPMPTTKLIPHACHAGSTIKSICRQNDPETRLPNIEELISMFCNRELLKIPTNQPRLWSSSVVTADKTWYLHIPSGQAYAGENSNAAGSNCRDVYCIRR